MYVLCIIWGLNGIILIYLMRKESWRNKNFKNFL
jgi:hypothetical protein